MKAKPFARMMNHTDFEEFNNGLIEELNLRQAVAQLQDWRAMRIGDLKGGEKYEQEKAQRAQKAQPMGSLDRERFASSQRQKAAPAVETPSGAAAFIAPELVIRSAQSGNGETGDKRVPDKALMNGHANGSMATLRPKYQTLPLSGVTPMSLVQENAPDMHLLTPEEIDLCEKIRIHPKPYLVIKETIMKEALKANGQLKKKQVRELSRLEGGKGSRVADFLAAAGWVLREK